MDEVTELMETAIDQKHGTAQEDRNTLLEEYAQTLKAGDKINSTVIRYAGMSSERLI